MSKKPSNPKSKNTFAILMILILLGAGAVSMFYMASATDPLPDNTDDIINNNDPNDNTDDVTVTVWQSIYVKNADNSDYWYNAPKPFSLNLLGSSTGDENDLTRITAFANTINMQPQTDSFTSWSFSCKETIIVQDLDGNNKKTVADSMAVSNSGQSANKGQNTQITSAWLTESQLEQIISLPAGQYYLVIAIGDIFLTATTTDGESVTLTSDINSSSQQVLQWLIEIT